MSGAILSARYDFSIWDCLFATEGIISRLFNSDISSTGMTQGLGLMETAQQGIPRTSTASVHLR